MLLLSVVACESPEGKNLLYMYILKYGLEYYRACINGLTKKTWILNRTQNTFHICNF